MEQLRARSRHILMIEDSDEDYRVLLWAMKRLALHHPVERCGDGDAALGRLRAPRPRPALVLLDLNLAAADGCEVLAAVKADPALRTIPVVVWTTSAHPEDVDRCYRAGADSYVLEPLDMVTFLHEVQALARYWFDVVMLPGETLP